MVTLRDVSESDGEFDTTGNTVLLKPKHHIVADFSGSNITWYNLEIMEMPGLKPLPGNIHYKKEGSGSDVFTMTCSDDNAYVLVHLLQYKEGDKITDVPPPTDTGTGTGTGTGLFTGMSDYNMLIAIAVIIAIVIVLYLLFKHGIITKEHILG